MGDMVAALFGMYSLTVPKQIFLKDRLVLWHLQIKVPLLISSVGQVWAEINK